MVLLVRLPPLRGTGTSLQDCIVQFSCVFQIMADFNVWTASFDLGKLKLLIPRPRKTLTQGKKPSCGEELDRRKSSLAIMTVHLNLSRLS